MSQVYDLSQERRGDKPCDMEAEQAILGAVLRDNRLVDDLADQIAPEMFHEPTHGRLFAKVLKIVQAGRLADAVTVFHGEQDAGLLQMGGFRYLLDLIDKAPTSVTSKDYAPIIRRLWQQREMLTIGQEVITAVRQGVEPDQTIEAAERALLAVQVHSRGVQLVTAAEAAERVTIQFDNPRAAYGVKTGLDPLDDVTGGFMPGELWLLAGRPGMGKEQPVDTPTLTPDGWRDLGDLQSGDFVIGADGHPTRIVRVHPQGVKAAYRVGFRDLSSVECGLNHLWTVYSADGRRRHEPQTMTLSKLMDSRILRPRSGRIHAHWRVPQHQAVVFAPSDPLPIDPYVLGVLIGDGALSGSDMRFSNSDRDRDISERVRTKLGPDFRLHENRSNSCPYFDIRGEGRKRLKAALESLGLRVLSPAKRVPLCYMLASPAARLELLRGLMDTDGSCTNGRVAFHTTSAALAKNVTDLVRSLGGLAICRGYDRSHHDKPFEFQVGLKTAFAPFYTPHKLVTWKPKVSTRYIRSIEYSRDVEQVCIEVEAKDGLYLTKDFIVTHNSAIGSTAALNIATHGTGPSGEPLGVIEICSEMTVEQMTRRHIADLAHEMYGRDAPTYSAIRKRSLNAGQQRIFREAIQRYRELGTIRSLYRTGLTVTGLRGLIRRQKAAWAREGITLGLVTIDHMGLVRPSQTMRSRNEAQGEVARDTKEIAGELNCPLLALVQLNRKVEERDDHRPLLSDLRDTGEWEENADGVIGVYREAYYAQREPEPKRHDLKLLWDERRTSPYVDAIFMKIREGEAQTVRLWADMGRNAIRSHMPESVYRPAPLVDLMDPDVTLPHEDYDGAFD